MKLFTGRAHPTLAKRICEYLGLPLGRALMGNFPDGRNILQNRRGRPRPKRLHHPADLSAGQRKLDGTADNDRELPSGERGADQRGHTLFRLRPAGPQRRRAGADHRQVGGQPDYPRRRRPRVDDGPARGTNPGLFRHSGRSPLRGPGHRRPLQVDGTSATTAS